MRLISTEVIFCVFTTSSNFSKATKRRFVGSEILIQNTPAGLPNSFVMLNCHPELVSGSASTTNIAKDSKIFFVANSHKRIITFGNDTIVHSF